MWPSPLKPYTGLVPTPWIRGGGQDLCGKGRPQDNPLIVHCTGREQVEELVREIPKEARLLMERFWPGPLTLVLPKNEVVPGEVTAGLDTVAVRVPAHPVALSLLRR